MVATTEEETGRIKVRIGQSMGDAVRKIVEEENERQTDAIIREFSQGLRALNNSVSGLHHRTEHIDLHSHGLDKAMIKYETRINNVEKSSP